MVEAGSHQLVPQVAAGEVDLALVVLPVTDPLVVTTPLFDDPLVLATAPDHPFAGAAASGCATSTASTWSCSGRATTCAP